MKELVKKLLPAKFLKLVRPYYHGLIAVTGQWLAGWPSEKLIVIGVTGTSGKSTTINLLAHILNKNGFKTGFVTTANYSLGEKIFTNAHGLSMPSGWTLSGYLKKMLASNCKVVIVEATSEGLAQNRHAGINFDVCLLTNLSPAHLDSHGSFARYRSAKGKLFGSMSRAPKKKFFSKKMIGVNLDDSQSIYFLEYPAEKKFGITLYSERFPVDETDTYTPKSLKVLPNISFQLGDGKFNLPLIGAFNAFNILLATATACEMGIQVTDSAKALEDFHQMPGRMESIPNQLGVNIFVDYAPEPAGMLNALSTLSGAPKIIHVFGSTGGTRDVGKRFEFGKISARFADTIIVTNDDVYDSNPNQIAQNVIEGIDSLPADEKKATEVIIMLERRAAITQGLRLAKAGDTLIITGKGSEQFLVLPGNKRIAWDDRSVVKEELEKL